MQTVGWRERVAQRPLALASLALFLLGAVPLLGVAILPYQDLPNHLASMHVLQHPELYPEFVGNGFFKTNAALFAWLHVAGPWLGLHLAAKLFSLAVIALGAWSYPRVIAELSGKTKVALSASWFLWPMVGSWWLLMGMLDYALAIPLSLWLLVLALRNWRAPSLPRTLGLVALAIGCWYTHAFALLVVGMLLVLAPLQLRALDPGVSASATRGALLLRYARWVLVPLVPASGLLAWSVLSHLTEPSQMTGSAEMSRFLPVWELLYHLWAEWCCGFGWRTLTSFVVVIGGVLGLWRARAQVPFFSPLALVVLCALYMLLPYSMTNWFHVSSRIVPYVWLALLVRLPEQLPRWLVRVLALSALAFGIGHTVEYQLLDRDRREFTAGVEHVAPRAKLLPLVFTRKQHSEHTQSLLHAWGYYVLERDTSAPLLFAHSRGFPVMYREPPKERFNHLVLESFPARMKSERAFCERSRSNAQIVHDDCEGEYRQLWREFWQEATPEFDHLLLWDAPAKARATIPPVYRLVFEQGHLAIYRR